jgi:hypothetical protein
MTMLAMPVKVIVIVQNNNIKKTLLMIPDIK